MHDECLYAATLGWRRLLHEVKMHFVIAFGGATTPKIVLVLTFLLLRSYFASVITFKIMV
jgi:hypothetical protein